MTPNENQPIWVGFRSVSFLLKNRSQGGALFFLIIFDSFCPSGLVFGGCHFDQKSLPGWRLIFFGHFWTHFAHLGWFLLGVIFTQKSLPGWRLIFFWPFLTHFAHQGWFSVGVILIKN